MKKEHLIILGVAAVGVYLYMSSKKKKEAAAAAAALVPVADSNFSNARGIVRGGGSTTDYNSTWCNCNGVQTKCILGATGTCEDCCGIANEPKRSRM